MLKLIFQYFGHLMWRTGSLEKTLILGKIKGRRRGQLRMRYGWMASLTQWTWVWASSGSWCWTGKPGLLQCMELKRVRQDWAPELKLQLHDKDWNVCVCQWLSCVQLFATPWTVARHAPLSTEFLRQEMYRMSLILLHHIARTLPKSPVQKSSGVKVRASHWPQKG